MRPGLPAALLGAAVLAASATVFAQVQDRFQVASDPNARGYPRSLTVVIDSPPD